MNTPRVGDKVYHVLNPERVGVATAHDVGRCRVEWDGIHSSWVEYADLCIKEWAHTSPPRRNISCE